MDIKKKFEKCESLKDYERFIVMYRNAEDHYTHKARLAVIKIYNNNAWSNRILLIIGAGVCCAICIALFNLAMSFDGTSSEVGGFIGFISVIGVLAFAIAGLCLLCMPIIFYYRTKHPLLPTDISAPIDIDSAFWELTCLKKSVSWLSRYVNENNSKITNNVLVAKHILDIKIKNNPSVLPQKYADWLKDNIGSSKDFFKVCASGLAVVALFFLVLYAKDEYKSYKAEKNRDRFEQQMKSRQEQWDAQIRQWEIQNREFSKRVEQLNSKSTSSSRPVQNYNQQDYNPVSNYNGGYPTYTTPSQGNSKSSFDQNQSMIQMYIEQYNRMEKNIESAYNSLTNLGYRYNQDGNINGYTGRNDPYIGQQIANFKQMQHDMANIRYEASKLGYNIPQSQWETANVNL